MMILKANKMIKIFYLAFLVLLASCRPSESEREFYFEGKVEEGLVEYVQEVHKRGGREITVNSTGGSIKEAIAAARLIQEYGMSLRIRDNCLSACSSILIPSSKKVIVEAGTAVAFHNIPGVWYYINEYFERKEIGSLRNLEIFELSQEIVDLYESNGLKADIFPVVAIRKGLRCYKLDRDEQGEVLSVELFFNSKLYMPSMSLLSQFGWQTQFADFGDLNARERAADALIDANEDASLFVEDPDYVFPQELAEKPIFFSRLMECPWHPE